MGDPPSSDEFRFRAGVISRPDRVVLLAGRKELEDDEVSNTFVFLWTPEGKWGAFVKNWDAGSLSLAHVPEREVIVLGADRQIFSFGTDIEPLDGLVSPRGTVASVASIGGRAYIVGMRGFMARRTSREAWEEVDIGLPNKTDIGLEAIAGTSENDMYAVGWLGAIVWFRDGVATQIPIPTNAILTSVCIGGDGYVYCCGQKGILLRGLGMQWSIIDHESSVEDLWSVRWFQGKLHVASARFVYVLNDEDKLELLDMGAAAAMTAHCLDVYQDRMMLSVGQSDVGLFTGKEWIALVE